MAIVVPHVSENNTLCLYAVTIGRDGIGIKPEHSFDPVRKVLVGQTVPVDSEYISNNPVPDEKEIKPITNNALNTIHCNFTAVEKLKKKKLFENIS